MRQPTYAERVLLASRDECRSNAQRAVNGLAVGTAGMFSGTQDWLGRTLLLLQQKDPTMDAELQSVATTALEWTLKLDRWLPPLPGRYAELKAVLHDLASGH